METANNRPAWMEDEQVRSIDPKKLEFLGKLFQDSRGKNQKELMMFLMPMMKKAKLERLIFTQQEMQAAIQAIKRHSTEDELKQIEKILTKAQNGGK